MSFKAQKPRKNARRKYKPLSCEWQRIYSAPFAVCFAISALNYQRGKPTELSYNVHNLFLFLISNVLNLGGVEIRPPDVLKSHT
jgi:hypothetical protein